MRSGEAKKKAINKNNKRKKEYSSSVKTKVDVEKNANTPIKTIKTKELDTKMNEVMLPLLLLPLSTYIHTYPSLERSEIINKIKTHPSFRLDVFNFSSPLLFSSLKKEGK